MFKYELNNQDKLNETIIQVIVFFDLFDFPLTAFELWHYLDKQIRLQDIINVLEVAPEIESKNGLYFLAGRGEILKTRRERHNYFLRKYKIAQRFVRYFSFLPFIKVITLSNSIGQFNLRDGSDIDLFIITARRRIWLTRLFCAGIAKILNRRPTPKNKKDKICLSFYISEENLNLDNLQMANGDPYFFFWLRSLVLLYNKDKVYEKFLVANCLPLSEISAQSLDSVPAVKQKTAGLNKTFNYFERVAQKIQLIVMSPALKKAMNNSIGVVISDNILKLYLHDKRLEYAEKYANRLRQIFEKNN